MKLSISNIIWAKGRESFPGFLDAASESAVEGVELALNAIFDEPAALADSEVVVLHREISKRGLSVSALHSLTFTRPELELFGAPNRREALLDYLLQYARIARLLKCRHLVFGSPSARRTHGLPRSECNDIFLSFLDRLSKRLGDISFNIEPLPAATCEYLHTLQDAKDLVIASSLKNIGIQLDLRACIENDEGAEQIRSALPFITHCQVSDPGLTLLTGTYSKKHILYSSLLHDARYSGFVAGEMLAPEEVSGKVALQKAVASMRAFYG